MPCVESHASRLAWRQVVGGLSLLGLVVLSACGLQSRDEGSSSESKSAPPSSPTVSAANGVGKRAPKLPAPETQRSWPDVRLQAARRMVAANPDAVYMGKPPDILLAIPVLSVELNGDGSIRHISVMRYPRQARETVAMAMDAVRRAAPFGDVSRLPKPWRFNETFLFNGDKKFKPMTLDQH